jgi:hypothetical protein
MIGTSSQKAPHSKHQHPTEQDPLVATSSRHNLAEVGPLVPLSTPAQHTLSQPALGGNQPTARATHIVTMKSSMVS